MSMGFSFAVVPFTSDGDLVDLDTGVPEYGDMADYLKEGVVMLETMNEDRVHRPLGLSLNIAGVTNVDTDTDGAFLEVTGGDSNQRYVLLEPRRESLERLRASIPNMGTDFRRRFVEVFVENAERVLKQHGKKAALLIF